MSKTNKSKSSMANVIKERAQRPDFLPKAFIEDNTRLADETHSRSHVPTLSSDHAPTIPLAQKIASSAAETILPDDLTHAREHAPTRPRTYAQAVLNAQADELGGFVPVAKTQSKTNLSAAKQSPYRRDLKRASTYLADAAKDQLRVLCFNERTSEEDLLREAIDMLFQQRGLPTIAFQGAPSRQQRPH